MLMLCHSRMDSFRPLRIATIQMATRVYDVAVRVQDDGDLSSLRSFSVNILDQDDPPFFTQFPAEPIALSEDSISTDWNAPSLFAD